VHPGQAISTNAITVVNDMLWDVYNRIMRESENLLIVSKKSTIDARCIQTAVRLTIPGELAKHAVSEGIVQHIFIQNYYQILIAFFQNKFSLNNQIRHKINIQTVWVHCA
jgi:hypothetical protein